MHLSPQWTSPCCISFLILIDCVVNITNKSDHKKSNSRDPLPEIVKSNADIDVCSIIPSVLCVGDDNASHFNLKSINSRGIKKFPIITVRISKLNDFGDVIEVVDGIIRVALAIA